MTRTIHIGMSVRGAIRNGEWRTTLVGAVKDDDGRVLTAYEILDALFDELVAGHEIIPFGPACDRWDWLTGCQGHENTEGEVSQNVAKR